jgi:hypothetical protein
MKENGTQFFIERERAELIYSRIPRNHETGIGHFHLYNHCILWIKFSKSQFFYFNCLLVIKS